MLEQRCNLEKLSSFDSSSSFTPAPAIDWHQKEAGLGDFVGAAAYSAIQVPSVAVAQILDQATGSKVAENLTLVQKPEAADFGSAKWHVQQVGAAVGGLVPFFGALALTKKLSFATDAEEFALAHSKSSAAATASTFRTGEMTAAGFLQGALFEPGSNKEQMLEDRFKQGITSGITMGSMHVLSNKFSTLFGASATDATLLSKSLTTGLAGAGAGAIGLNVDELLSGRKISHEERVQSIYQAAFTGAALGGAAGAHLRLHQPMDQSPALSDFVARNKDFQISESLYIENLRRSATPWRVDKSPISMAQSFDALTSLPHFSPMEKAELVNQMHRDADPLLRRPEVIRSFLQKVEGSWSDDLERRNSIYNEALDRASALDESFRLQKNDGTESKQDGRDYAAIKRLLKKQEAALDGLLDERGEALDQHRRRLETAVNEFLAEHKLPGIRLRVLPAMEVDGSYASGDVSIHGRQLLSKQLEPILVNHIYHELTHLRQDVLTIRLFADELGLPQHPSPEQVDRIKTAFARHAEGEDAEFKNTLELSSENRSFREIREKLDRLVDEVLILRSEGAPELSAEETKLAQRMRQGKQDYRDQQHVAGFVETERRLERTNDFLDLNTPDLTALALNQIISKPADFKAMFGFSEIPVELEQLAREHSQNPQRLTEADLAEPSKLNPTLEQFDYYENLFAKIKPIFVKHSNSLFASYSDLLAQKQKLYVSTELEKQSFPTGLLAELTHRANNQ
jgi:hypothetical protein